MKTLLSILALALLLTSCNANTTVPTETPERPLASVAGHIAFYDSENLLFESYDGETRWYLTKAEAGITPNYTDTFVLTYDDFGTTSCDHPDCECYVYDDEFVMIERA